MKPKVICFDLGGVLAHVNLTWAGAMRRAGFHPTVPDGGKLEDCLAFMSFQNGDLNVRHYLEELAGFLKISSDQALAVHDGILDRPVEGTFEIIQALNQMNLVTACLSNTNAPHWDVLTNPNRFPNIARLKLKRASHLYGVSKPDELVFRVFENDAGAQPREILFFEDNFANVQAAIQFGWNPIQINPNLPQAPQILAGLVKHHVLHSDQDSF